MPREGIEPFYFGSSTKPLFGCYHAPLSDRTRDCSLVLCYPMGEEYIRFHRAFRRLAHLLARNGFPVLRFDFYGCGDSSGDSDQGQIAQWVSDVSTAMAETRQRSAVAKVCPVGLRLGAALSMMAGALRGDVDGMVLWDPVVSGQSYLQELTTLHQEMLVKAHVQPKPRKRGEEQAEILGFPLTDELRAGLQAINLATVQQKPANKVLIVESTEAARLGQFKESLERMQARVAYKHLPSPQLWGWVEDFDSIPVPHRILQSVLSWIQEVYG